MMYTKIARPKARWHAQERRDTQPERPHLQLLCERGGVGGVRREIRTKMVRWWRLEHRVRVRRLQPVSSRNLRIT